MSNNELLIIENLDYNQIIADLLKPNDSYKRFQYQVSYKTIVLVALVTGLPLRTLINLKWSAILEYDDIGGAKCLDYFDVKRGYNFAISGKIQKQLLQFYTYLNQPNFDKPIAAHFKDYKILKNWHMSVNLTLGMRKIKEIGEDVWSEYQNEYLTQIILGRRMIETCGYSNKIGDFLKGLFNIKTNQQLFTFLGYESKTDFKYSLANISLIEGVDNRFEYGKPKRFLNDNKHFYKLKRKSQECYPFQHFQVFYDFLKTIRLSDFDLKIRGVLVLLMISLTNGIRPSSLLKLMWSDLFVSGKNGELDCYALKNSFKLGRHLVTLDPNTKKQILIQFKLLHAGAGGRIDTDNYQLTFIAKAPSLNDSCFVTTRMNTLTQPSLKREIINALKMARFQHADKFETESTMVMYGRRVIELKGNHTPTIRALVKHFKKRSKKELFKFLYIDFKGAPIRPENLGEFTSDFEHILYDI